MQLIGLTILTVAVFTLALIILGLFRSAACTCGPYSSNQDCIVHGNRR